LTWQTDFDREQTGPAIDQITGGDWLVYRYRLLDTTGVRYCTYYIRTTVYTPYTVVLCTVGCWTKIFLFYCSFCSSRVSYFHFCHYFHV